MLCRPAHFAIHDLQDRKLSLQMAENTTNSGTRSYSWNPLVQTPEQEARYLAARAERICKTATHLGLSNDWLRAMGVTPETYSARRLTDSVATSCAPPAWKAAILAARMPPSVGTAFHRRPRLGGTPRPTPAWIAAILAAHHPPTNHQPTNHQPTNQLTNNQPTNYQATPDAP